MLPIRRIGLRPGSFNPAHLGHIDLALQACHRVKLDACYFYINSINAAKQVELIPWRQRQELLELLLDDGRQVILGPDYFADNHGGVLVPQEAIFFPLIEKLTVCYGQPSEVWLVRRSDNFRPRQGDELPYPLSLCRIPHITGCGCDDHREYDYSQILRKIFVKTRSARRRFANFFCTVAPRRI
jgi:Cytidylyltransferase-like